MRHHTTKCNHIHRPPPSAPTCGGSRMPTDNKRIGYWVGAAVVVVAVVLVLLSAGGF